jgi:hypothetical protein
VAAAEARHLKQSLRVLLVCTLASNHVLKDVSGHEATIDDPFEYTTDKPYVVVRFGQLWLYDSSTGRIIKEVASISRLLISMFSGIHHRCLGIFLSIVPELCPNCFSANTADFC